MSERELHPVVPEPDPPASPGLGRVAALLRATGAAVLLASVSLFLFRGWDGGNDIQRYLLLLLETAGLAGVSLVIGNALKEGKGARLLVTLALACVPANFAILGAFLYSQFVPLTNPAAVASYVQMFTWSAPGLASALLVNLLGVAVLAPVAGLGFRVMAPNSWPALTGLFLLANAALLVPMRMPWLVGLGTLALAMFLAGRVHTITRRDRSLLALEGIVARLLIGAPLLVLLGRNLSLHATDSTLVLCIALLAFATLRYVTAEVLVAPWLRRGGEQASVAFAIMAALAAIDLLARGPLHALALPLGASVSFGLATELSLRASAGAAAYRLFAASALTAALLANLIAEPGVTATVACLAGGIGLLAYGALAEQRAAFLAGAGCSILGLLDQFVRIVHGFDLNSWGALGIAGVLAIVLGSFLERHGARLRNQALQWRARYAAWQL